MRRVAFTIIVCLIFANFFGSPSADDRITDQTGSPEVVDGSRREIGSFFFVGRMTLPSSSVLREIDGSWYLLPFSPTGFSSTGVEIFYSDDNCKGAAYVAAHPDNLVMVPQAAGTVGIANGTLYYPKPGTIKSSSTVVKPGVKLILKSQRMLTLQGKDVGCGKVRQSVPDFAGDMATVELSKLGFVPPFSLIAKKLSPHQRHSSKKE